MELKWEEGFFISVRTAKNEVKISANREGLLSLVHHLLALAQEKAGCHIHLDQYNSLEDESPNLIIEKID
ncbi:MAG: hypothetical protein J5846_03205 [Desulfovibrio sp.]|nr:hypothetical protein [Desulfovibrio sp.]